MRVGAPRIAVAVLALALPTAAGCARQSTPSSDPAAQVYFPMIGGGRWVYRLSTGRGNLQMEVTARGEMALPDGRGNAFVMDERNLGPNLGFVETSPVAYVAHEGYVARINAIDYDASGQLRTMGLDEPTWVLPLDAAPGQRWVQSTGLFQTPEGGGAQLGWSGEIKALTSVTVPAGRFDDVLEVEIQYRDTTGGDAMASEVVYHDYYARGVGLVRSVSEGRGEGSQMRIEQVLLEYHFPE